MTIKLRDLLTESKHSNHKRQGLMKGTKQGDIKRPQLAKAMLDAPKEDRRKMSNTGKVDAKIGLGEKHFQLERNLLNKNVRRGLFGGSTPSQESFKTKFKQMRKVETKMKEAGIDYKKSPSVDQVGNIQGRTYRKLKNAEQVNKA